MPAEAAPSQSPRSPQVLLVDDDPAIQELMTTLLARRGVRVLSALTGESALERARDDAPALILLDIVLPGEDGFHILAALKADEATRHIPVIMFSVLETPAHMEKARKLGALDAIPKPFDMREAVDRILQALEKDK